jgi:site-specific recombinase XerD
VQDRILEAVPDALAAWIDEHVPRETLLKKGPLFVSPRTDRAWAPTSFRRVWAKACKKAVLPTLEPYETLRHSTATEWMRWGASEREVQELLGHRTRHATPRHARLADERLESIVGRRRDEN